MVVGKNKKKAVSEQKRTFPIFLDLLRRFSMKNISSLTGRMNGTFHRDPNCRMTEKKKVMGPCRVD